MSPLDTHPREEDLILHFYGEDRHDGAESEIDAHLRDCPSCQLTWTELRETLALVDAASVPEPGPAFEDEMWTRVRAALPSRRPASSGWRLAWWLSPVVGVAAAVVVAVASGRLPWRTATMPTASVAPTASAPVVVRTAADLARSHERVLLTALDSHFQRSEMLLVEVMNGPDKGADLEFERQMAGDLLDSGRLYRMAAEQNGDVRLAAMLEDMESVLVEIARSSDAATRKDVEALRARIDGDDLLFKVRAVTNQIHQRQRLLSTE